MSFSRYKTPLEFITKSVALTSTPYIEIYIEDTGDITTDYTLRGLRIT